ncbi:hypothetical protein MTO96_048025 [Rhipicephalus appendiculatus]
MRSTVLTGLIALVICSVTHCEGVSLRAHQRNARVAMFPPQNMMPISGRDGGGYHPSMQGHAASADNALGPMPMDNFPGMDGDAGGAGQPPSSSHFFG